ncbi:MAG TPA: hypothetical protein VGK48_18420 [Terriglobia bacterium]|jgi:hypothetical protein
MQYVSESRHTNVFIAALVALYLILPGMASAERAPAQPFRLGTAAMPFGWATAVADLDADQQLDFAVADRTSSGAYGYSYKLELSLSHAGNQIFHFRSSDSALKVSIVDLDNDADLDIVLTHALSGRIAGVWLNNGRGGFQQGNTDDFLQADAKTHAAATFETLNPRETLAVPLERRSADDPDGIRLDRPVMPSSPGLMTSQDVYPVEASHRFLVPRAPPAAFPL